MKPLEPYQLKFLLEKSIRQEKEISVVHNNICNKENNLIQYKQNDNLDKIIDKKSKSNKFLKFFLRKVF